MDKAIFNFKLNIVQTSNTSDVAITLQLQNNYGKWNSWVNNVHHVKLSLNFAWLKKLEILNMNN